MRRPQAWPKSPATHRASEPDMSASNATTVLRPKARFAGWWRAVLPVALAALLAMLPPPAGLPQHAWYFFALFAGVIAALVTEPLPNPAVGMIGLTLAAVLSRYVLFGPADLAKPGFNVVSQSVNW